MGISHNLGIWDPDSRKNAHGRKPDACAQRQENACGLLLQRIMPRAHWWNGAGGKLENTLDIDCFPTIFVANHQGMICYIDTRGEELETAVNEIFAQMNEKPK
jgi:hypothetical protein